MSHGSICAIVGVVLLALTACVQSPAPVDAPRGKSPTAMVEAIRAVAAADKSVVQVAPLRDPAVDGYLQRAHAAVQASNYSQALQGINAALKLSPNAPGILQFRAEVEILLLDFSAAEADARQAFALGPKVGGVCASHWQTVLEIAESRGDPLVATSARDKRDACHKAPPVRM